MKEWLIIVIILFWQVLIAKVEACYEIAVSALLLEANEYVRVGMTWKSSDFLPPTMFNDATFSRE